MDKLQLAGLVRFPEPYGAPELLVGPTRMFGFDDNDRNRIFFQGQQETTPIRKRDGLAIRVLVAVRCIPSQMRVSDRRSYHTIKLEAFAQSAKCFAVRMTLG